MVIILCRNKNLLGKQGFQRSPQKEIQHRAMMRPFKVLSLTLKSVQRDPKVFFGRVALLPRYISTLSKSANLVPSV